MKFKLEVKMDNAAFHPEYEHELCRILELVADRFEKGETKLLVRDTNGNTVGKAEVIFDD